MTVAAVPKPGRRQISVWGVLAQLGMAGLLLFLMLIGTVFGPLYYLLAIAGAGWFVYKRYYIQAIVCLFGVSAFAVALAVGSYLHGSARFEYMGLPNMEFFNVDPVYRCGHDTGGCLVKGTEWLTQEPNNFVLRHLINYFGPQRGSYTGPYPTEAEANAALDGAQPVALSDILEDRFVLGGARVRMAKGLGQRIAERWINPFSFDEIKKLGIEKTIFGPVTATVWKERVLLMRGPPTDRMIAAIDLNTGKAFAFYNGKERFPPARWDSD
jgi:hypothetical protein